MRRQPLAAAKPVGMVVLAENAHLSGVTANIGADVFAGDVLHTDPGGNLRMKFGATQLYLNSASAATIGQEAPPLRVSLTQGTLGFSSNAADQFEIETPVGIVRGADGQRAFGEVTILRAAHNSRGGLSRFTGCGRKRGAAHHPRRGDSYNVTFVRIPHLEDEDLPRSTGRLSETGPQHAWNFGI